MFLSHYDTHWLPGLEDHGERAPSDARVCKQREFFVPAHKNVQDNTYLRRKERVKITAIIGHRGVQADNHLELFIFYYLKQYGT